MDIGGNAGQSYRQSACENYPASDSIGMEKCCARSRTVGIGDILDRQPTGVAIAVTFTRLSNLLFLKASRLSRLHQLSPREMTVVQLFGGGLSYKEIAKRLDIAPATVRNLLQRIYAKLGIGDKAELAALIAGQ